MTPQEAGRVRHGPATDAAVRAAICERTPIAQIMEQYGVSRTYVQVRARRLGQPYPKSPGPDHPWRHRSVRKDPVSAS